MGQGRELVDLGRGWGAGEGRGDVREVCLGVAERLKKY